MLYARKPMLLGARQARAALLKLPLLGMNVGAR